MKKFILPSLSILFSITIVSNAHAATQTVNAGVSFVSPIAISNVVNANFGNVTAGVASTVYALDTAGNITTTSGPGAYITGSKNSASFTITGSATQSINISSGSYTANNGVTPSAATCKYGSGAAMLCDATALNSAAGPGSTGTALTMGLSITAANIADGVTASPSFEMTVVYN